MHFLDKLRSQPLAQSSSPRNAPSKSSEPTRDVDQQSLTDTLVELPRGEPRPTGIGRGGIGNIRAVPNYTPVFPQGRELTVDPKTVFSVGRGGRGNLYTPSKELPQPPVGPDAQEVKLIKSRMEGRKVIVSGRGGSGNIRTS